MPKLLALAFPLIGAVCSSLHLRERMQELALPVGGTVGAAAMVIETGQRVSWNGGERLPMQSVYKVPIAMAVLARVDRGELDLERKIRVEEKDLAPGHSPLRDKYPHGGVELTVRGLLRSMIVDSDNTACDVLLTVVPPGGVTRFLRASDAQEITVATSERRWRRAATRSSIEIGPRRTRWQGFWRHSTVAAPCRSKVGSSCSNG